MTDINKWQTTILAAAAAADDQNGQDIARRIEQAHGVDVSNGRLYPNLDALVDAGLLTQRTDGGRANRHNVTDRGMRELEARLDYLLRHADANPRYDLAARTDPEAGVDLERRDG